MQIIRRAEAGDAAAIAELWLSSRRAAEIPPAVHSDDEVRGWVRDVLLPACEVWVAIQDETVIAMMALDGEWIEQLYLAPEHQRRGIGGRLLDLAKATRPSLLLWTFESNAAAQRFYEANGFRRWGEPSSDNEEQAPAIRYRWQRPASDDQRAGRLAYADDEPHGPA